MKWFVGLTESGTEIFVCVAERRLTSCIADESNPYYQEYLAWLAEGNTPEPWNPEPAPIDEAQSSTDAG